MCDGSIWCSYTQKFFFKILVKEHYYQPISFRVTPKCYSVLKRQPMRAYDQLESLFTTIYRLQHVLGLCHWDMNTYMAPKAQEARGEAISLLNKIEFQSITAPEVKKWIDEATTGQDELSPVQRSNLRKMTMLWSRMNLLSEGFLHRKAKLTTMAHGVWKRSRAANRFADFLPILRALVSIAREEGAALAAGSSRTPYEALMDVYEPGLTIPRMDALIANLKSWLPRLLRDVVKKQAAETPPILPFEGPFPEARQAALGRDLMRVWKFDFEAGRLDSSPHPFTGMTKEDCRLTTAYAAEDPLKSLFAVVHEVGHGKYEQNIGPRRHLTQPICTAPSLGAHESQSLFAEFQLARDPALLEVLRGKLEAHLGPQAGFSPANFRRAVHRVRPGFLRVGADEVSYPLHVILRYEIERDLVDGGLPPEAVPAAWEAKMKEYFGLETAGRDDRGCLQDIHWSLGSIGYFPTYLIGAMFAAQLMATIREELGEEKLRNALQTGDLECILAKQKEKIWDHGSLYTTDELIERATGEGLNPAYLHQHLVSRYLGDAG
ncbi:unnamed protein product [Phytomonas sp. Hart1]|nr:unnamed protein product [Phytomonas sp. Hart1]|eukprot:CCW71441.1 unnamed protein product [Phytomonas sp. isolate Hart1]